LSKLKIPVTPALRQAFFFVTIQGLKAPSGRDHNSVLNRVTATKVVLE